MDRTSLIFWQCMRSLVLCVCFVDCRLSFCTFSFGHCVVCSSIIWFLITPLVSSNSSYSSDENNNVRTPDKPRKKQQFLSKWKQCWTRQYPCIKATITSFENNAELIYRVPIKVLVMWKHRDIAAGSDVLVIPYSNVYCETIFSMGKRFKQIIDHNLVKIPKKD